MTESTYPEEIEKYGRFIITEYKSFVKHRLVARSPDSVHTRFYNNGKEWMKDRDEALELLKEDIDNYG